MASPAPPFCGTIQIVPSTSTTRRASRPACTEKFVASVIVTCALAAAAQSDNSNIAIDLFKLAIGHHGYQFPVVDVDAKLHRLATNLAVLDIRLRAGRCIHDDTDGFAAEGTMQVSFVQPLRHDAMSGLQAGAGPLADRKCGLAVGFERSFPARAIMNPIAAFDPEFDAPRPDAVTAPV